MAEEKKSFDRYPQYNKLSDEQQKEFKKALFLTKGAVNNDVGCTLAFYGLSGEDIAKYGASWKDAAGVSQGSVLKTRHDCTYPYLPRSNAKGKLTGKRLLQQIARIPDLFDTIRGRALVAKYGEEVKDEFCDKHGKCPLITVDRDSEYEKLLDRVEFIDGSTTGYEFGNVKTDVKKEYCLQFRSENAAKLEFLEKTKASNIAKAKSKGIELAKIYGETVERNPRAHSGHGAIEDFPEFNKDFWKFFIQDLSALANVPIEGFKRKLRMDESLTEFSRNLVTVMSAIGKQIIGSYYYSSDVYSSATNATFNCLFIRAMYTAMDEMGVTLVGSRNIYTRGHLSTRMKRVANKVISLNEKYQKMLKNKSNKIEPAILRQTLVDMFNEYADRSDIEFRMFIREDKPAPTLAELFPAKQPKATKTTRAKAPRKRSTGPKEVVKVEGVGTFVEY